MPPVISSLQCLSNGLRERSLRSMPEACFALLMRTSIHDRGFGRNHIGARSALNHAGIYRHALPQIVQLRDYRDLTGQFKNGAVSFAGIESRMRRDAFHAQACIRPRLCARS